MDVKSFTEIQPIRVSLYSRIRYGGYTQHRTDVITPDTEGEFVTSALPGIDEHIPLFDIDYPAELRPSKTDGHFHLILHRPVPWRRYKRAMKALVRAGLMDRNYYDLAVKRKQGLLRRYDLTPTDVSTTVDNT